MAKWQKGKVLVGEKLGRKLGFPTANLDLNVWPASCKSGVYAAFVRYKNKSYKSALYFGPRMVLGETQNVLEIYILDFKKEIYGQTLFWQIGKFIRPPMDFSSLEALKIQLQKDVEEIRRLI